MKTIHFALVGAASLALAACNNSNQDTVPDNAAENYDQTEQLNDLASDAANQVEAESLANQAAQLNESAQDTATENNEAEEMPEEEAVNGM